MKVSRLALLFLLLSPLAFAVSPIDLTFAVPIVAVIVTIFLAATYMLSGAISNPGLEAWVKTEIRELIVAVVLIVLVIFLFIGSDGISVALTGTTSYVNTAVGITQNWLTNYDNAFTLIIQAATKIRVAATYSPYISISLWWVAPNYSTNPLAGIAMLLGILSIATQGLTNAIFIYEGLQLMVLFLQVTIPKILLPLAFVFRLIPFTRRLGNTLIAVSIAGLVFLPFAIILANDLNQSVDFPQPTMNLGNLDSSTGVMDAFGPLCQAIPIRFILLLNEYIFGIIVCLPLLLAVVTAPGYPVCAFTTVPQVVYPLIMEIFMGVGAALLIPFEIYYSAGGATSYANGVYDTVQPFLRDVNNLVLLGYIDFIIIAIVVVAGARSLSTALGGEWYLAGIQRLI